MTEANTDFRYDAFISYSHHDKEWVRGWLLPRLEAAGLRVCIDLRDFDVGVPSLVNIERAVDNSRRTVLVLSPAWMKSEWTEFEALLTQTADPASRRRRVLPLLLQPCKPPGRITMLSYADFTRQEDWESQLQRVVAAAQGELRLRDVGPQLSQLLEPEESPFLVPFPRNPHFVGRNDDLERLHTALKKGEPVGVRPAMLTGLGGIGKTQLAVEYAYRFQTDYPGGVYWVNAAQDWQAELASLAERVGLRVDDAPESERRLRFVLSFANFLNARPDALTIFDNVEDPRLLRTPAPGFIPAELKSRLLFTTRRRDPDLLFESIEVRVLSEPAALELLLHTKARREMLKRLQAGNADANPELNAARAICRSLGYLPLALALASAYLGKHPKISLSAYAKRLAKEGGLVTVDTSGIDPLDLPTRHDAAVTGTLKSQWDALGSEDARRVLQTVALLGEAAQVPRARLALLTGLADEAEEGYPAPLDEALIALRDLSLVDELTAHEIRLHPLVQKFAEGLIPDRPTFAEVCATRLADALWDCARLHTEVAVRGIDAVLTDLHTALSLSPPRTGTSSGERPGVRERLSTLLRPLDLEVHYLHNWNPDQQPSFFLQQLRNRCLTLNLSELLSRAEAQLTQWRFPHLRERFGVSRESEALVRSFGGHTGDVVGVAVTSDSRFAVSASLDHTQIVWDLTSGQAIRKLAGFMNRLHGVAVAPDGRFAIAGSVDYSKLTKDRVRKGLLIADYPLTIWDIGTGQIVRSLVGHTWWVNGLTVTPDGRFAVSASGGLFQSPDHTLKVWDLASGEAIRTLRGHTWTAIRVAITSDGRFAISTSEDTSIIVWDITTGQAVRALLGHQGSVFDVAITPNGRFAVSASWDGTLKVWDLATEKVTLTLVASAAPLCCAVTPDGRMIVFGDAAGAVHFVEWVRGQGGEQ